MRCQLRRPVFQYAECKPTVTATFRIEPWAPPQVFQQQLLPEVIPVVACESILADHMTCTDFCLLDHEWADLGKGRNGNAAHGLPPVTSVAANSTCMETGSPPRTASVRISAASKLRMYWKNSAACPFSSEAPCGAPLWTVAPWTPNSTYRVAVGQGSRITSPWRICRNSKRPSPSACIAARNRRSEGRRSSVEVVGLAQFIAPPPPAGCRSVSGCEARRRHQRDGIAPGGRP